jgi:hypothetical protein
MSWPTAVVVCVAIIVIGALGVLGVDTNAITWVLVTVVGGLGVGELRAIKEQTNGTQSKLMEQAAKHQDVLSELARGNAAPPPPAPPNGDDQGVP